MFITYCMIGVLVIASSIHAAASEEPRVCFRKETLTVIKDALSHEVFVQAGDQSFEGLKSASYVAAKKSCGRVGIVSGAGKEAADAYAKTLSESKESLSSEAVEWFHQNERHRLATIQRHPELKCDVNTCSFVFLRSEIWNNTEPVDCYDVRGRYTGIIVPAKYTVFLADAIRAMPNATRHELVQAIKRRASEACSAAQSSGVEVVQVLMLVQDELEEKVK